MLASVKLRNKFCFVCVGHRHFQLVSLPLNQCPNPRDSTNTLRAYIANWAHELHHRNVSAILSWHGRLFGAKHARLFLVSKIPRIPIVHNSNELRKRPPQTFIIVLVFVWSSATSRFTCSSIVCRRGSFPFWRSSYIWIRRVLGLFGAVFNVYTFCHF